jgi:HAMP domain-containing protein
MQAALTEAREESRNRLTRSLLLLALLVGLSTLGGLLLSRRQAVKITRPVVELTRAAEGLASGDRTVHVTIESGDELQRLGTSFNQMVDDLDASYKELEQVNRTLEQKVAERTLELADKNRDMRLVLDNVDQGFLTLGRDGVVSAERSRVVFEWFGPCEARTPFWEYVGRISSAFGWAFRLAWEQVVDDFLPLEASIEQLPDRLEHSGRTFSLRYLPLMKGRRMEGPGRLAATVRSAVAAPLLPAVEVRSPESLVWVARADEVTSTATWHDAPGGTNPPVRVIVSPPLEAVRTPPHVFVALGG